MHFALRLQHARLEDVGTEQGQEGPDDGLVLVSEVHAGARVAAAGVQLPLLVDQLHHRDDAVCFFMALSFMVLGQETGGIER